MCTLWHWKNCMQMSVFMFSLFLELEDVSIWSIFFESIQMQCPSTMPDSWPGETFVTTLAHLHWNWPKWAASTDHCSCDGDDAFQKWMLFLFHLITSPSPLPWMNKNNKRCHFHLQKRGFHSHCASSVELIEPFCANDLKCFSPGVQKVTGSSNAQNVKIASPMAQNASLHITRITKNASVCNFCDTTVNTALSQWNKKAHIFFDWQIHSCC